CWQQPVPCYSWLGLSCSACSTPQQGGGCAVRKGIMLVAAVVLLVAVNYGIYERERLLADGRGELLGLAPVDPPSLMQGDYMALRFKVANEARAHARLEDMQDGRLVLALNNQGVASFKRLADGAPLAPNEVQLRYRIRHGEIKFATNAFFFQEGHADYYSAARYGALRVAPNGEAILTALHGQNLERLGPPAAP